MEAPAVTLENLRASYDHRVLTEVSFTAAPGKTTVVAGSSGSGKTTLARVVLGLKAPDRGEVSVGGRSVVGVSPGELAEIHDRTAYLFSGLDAWALGRKDAVRSADPPDGVEGTVAVEENVRRATARPDVTPEVTEDRVRGALATFGLTDDAHRSAHELDPGARRRLALARVFAAAPALIVLDDPVAALTPTERDAVVAALQRARATCDATIVLTCYDVATTKAVGDHLVALVAGRVRVQGPVDRMLHLIKSDDDYAAQFAMGGGILGEESSESLAEHKKIGGLLGGDQRRIILWILAVGVLCLLAILLYIQRP